MTKSGSAKTHQEARRKLRRRLEDGGCSAAEVDQRVEEMRRRQTEARAATPARRERPARWTAGTTEERRAWQRERDAEAARYRARMEREQEATYARLSPDDTGYQPRRYDPLTTGVARATGVTARVTGRRNSVTKWQYDELGEGRSGR